MEMKDCKKERDSRMGEIKPIDGDEYPTLSFGDTYNGIPIDLDDVEVGDKVVVKLIVRLKSKTERKDKDGEKCDGQIEVLKAGFKPYDTEEMSKKPYKEIESEIDETLND